MEGAALELELEEQFYGIEEEWSEQVGLTWDMGIGQQQQPTIACDAH